MSFFFFFLSDLTRVTWDSHTSHTNLTCVMNKSSFVFMWVHMGVHMGRNSTLCATCVSRKSHTESYTSHMCATRMGHLSCSRGCISLCIWEEILTSHAWHAFHTILISHMNLSHVSWIRLLLWLYRCIYESKWDWVTFRAWHDRDMRFAQVSYESNINHTTNRIHLTCARLE